MKPAGQPAKDKAAAAAVLGAIRKRAGMKKAAAGGRAKWLKPR
jgi:hypothetical protein